MVALQCPHCGVYANFTKRWQGDEVAPWRQDKVACLTCDQCLRPIAAITESWGPLKEYWPKRILPYDFPDVPEEIAATASEAHLCLDAGAPRGGVALARAVVESVAKDKGIVNSKLVEKIDALHAAGHISEAMREAAHEIRFAGNEVAHGDLVVEPLGPESAEGIVSLMDEILHRVYQEPAQVARIRVDRERRKQGLPPRTPFD
jgi:hypothetical protein